MENKSIGGALVEVFDAAVTLVKSEITAVARRVGNIAKAKGLGVVLLLASLVPLTLALIFLILFVFYGLMRLGLGAWAAALLIALLSLAVTAALIFLGLRKLGEDVPDDEGGRGEPGRLSDIARDDLTYGAATATPTVAASTGPKGEPGHTTGGHPVQTPGGSGHDSTLRVAPAQTPATVSQAAATQTRPQQATTAVHGASQSPSGAPSPVAQSAAAQSTSTEGASSTADRKAGIEVSTHPTYQDDMKKEGY
ncbi:phage holin family protein [Deinococcus sp.]|uniref:phage holin family protein n=1 Tax=Deinococcus sp. TaxID=47478 RepID=UPI003C7ACD85